VNGATPKLQSAGQPDVNATSVGINNDGTVAIARFNLQGQAPGVRGVVMVNPGGASTISENAFTIEQGGGPQVWVDVVGRNVIRPGRPQTYYVYYGNRGNAEAYGVPLWITGIPKNAQVTLGFAVAQPPQPLGGYAVDYNQVPVVLEVATEKAVPLYLPVIRVGEAAALKITLTVPTPDPFVLRASTQTAIFNIITPIIVPGTSSPRQGIQSRDPATAPCPASSPRTSILNGGLESGLDCFNGLLSTGLSIAEAASPIPLPLRCGFSIAQSFAEEISTGYAGVTDPNANSTALSYVQTEVGVAGTALNCLEESVRTTIPPGRVIAGAQAVLSIPQTVASCGGFVSSLLGINFAFSLDPNDKIGSRGSGPDHFISGAEPLRYLIFFENLESATAPAQDVVITDQLDPAKLNFDTFSFGPISFGADKHVVPPAGLSAFNKDVDLRPAKNLIVRVEAKLEKETGLLTWRFTSLDPATGLPTDDPTAGFLPPNHTPPEGEGQVLFTVQTKQGLATGTEIRNRARIVFDTNAPIDTPEWLNTIDNSKPTSHVLQLEQTQSFVVFKVSWTGSDTGSGVKSYSVYSSENGEPFTPWLVDATATSAWFVGQPAKTYSFYTIARDATGNLEPPKTAAEATTTTTSAIINSIDDQRFFVYQHYADFLNRVPDEAGLDFWTRQITDCGSDQTCVELKRINVSAAFFLSIEFQETGYLVYRTYKAAYGNLAGAPIPLRLNEFLPDTRQIGQGVVVGQAGWEQVLENNKQIFAENLVARSRFTDSHSTALTPAAFVDTLFMNAAVLPTVAERTAAINEFGGAGNTSNAPARARALRRVAEHSTLKQQEFNKAFVLMQYFGYLRRNPNDPPEPMLDFGGYNFWLAKLDQFNGNFVNADMVKAFIVSAEYRQRFGP
jgi:hypothetical protein